MVRLTPCQAGSYFSLGAKGSTMSSPKSATTGRSILIIGESRGLGYSMAAEFAGREWRVVGTVRAPGTALHSLAAERPGKGRSSCRNPLEPWRLRDKPGIGR